MITHKTKLPTGEKALVVTLIRKDRSDVDIFAVEFRDSARKVRIKALLSNGNALKPGALPGDYHAQRQHAWRLVQRFVEKGSSALTEIIHPEETNVPAAPEQVALANGTVISFQPTAEQIAVIIRHNGTVQGDQMTLAVPAEPDRDVALNVMKGFYRELTRPDQPRMQDLLIDLEEFLLIERGARRFQAGERRKVAAELYRRHSKSTAELLEHWDKGPGPSNSEETHAFLRDGVEFETLRKRDGSMHLFPELRLALPLRYDSTAGYFVLRNSNSFELKFYLHPCRNVRAWQRMVGSVIETFARSPEALVGEHAADIDRDSTAPFPITDENLEAFQHIMHLYAINQKTLAAHRGELGDVHSDFQYRRKTFQVTFTHDISATLRVGIDFQIQRNGISAITVCGKRRLLGGTPRFHPTQAALSDESLEEIFSLFYGDGEQSLRKVHVKQSSLYAYLVKCCGTVEKALPPAAAEGQVK